jgi:predicted RNase H-like nuclease (RuvC/YqgF family)
MNTVKIECTKCHGKGTIRAYASVKSGVCFSCEGSGHHEVKMNEEELKQFKGKKQISSLETKLVRIEIEGKRLKNKIVQDREDYNKRLTSSIKTLGRQLENDEINLLENMYQFSELTEKIHQLRNEYKETKELIKMLGGL